MVTNNKWKDRLLSSGVPLEYEVAKILTNEGFFVDFDFAYQRFDEKEQKEFSIDILAQRFGAFDELNASDIRINLLIECKYRNPDVKWVFIPNFEIDDEIGDYGTSLKIIPHFSEIRFKGNNEMYPTNNEILPISDISKKGVEINIANGEVHDTGIHHGINQLIYSLPIVLSNVIKDSFENDLSMVFPFIFCPILVTTADLRILNSNFSIDLVKNTETLEGISKEIPYLLINTESYPSFKVHCENVFRSIPNKKNIERYDYFNELHALKVNSIEKENIEDSNHMIFPTANFMSGLKRGHGQGCFDDVVICNLKFLPDLIDKIKESVNKLIFDIEELKSTL